MATGIWFARALRLVLMKIVNSILSAYLINIVRYQNTRHNTELLHPLETFNNKLQQLTGLFVRLLRFRNSYIAHYAPIVLTLL